MEAASLLLTSVAGRLGPAWLPSSSASNASLRPCPGPCTPSSCSACSTSSSASASATAAAAAARCCASAAAAWAAVVAAVAPPAPPLGALRLAAMLLFCPFWYRQAATRGRRYTRPMRWISLTASFLQGWQQTEGPVRVE